MAEAIGVLPDVFPQSSFQFLILSLTPRAALLRFTFSCNVMASISPSRPPSTSSNDVQGATVTSMSREPTIVNIPLDTPLQSGSSSVINGKESSNHEMPPITTPRSTSTKYLSQEVAGDHTSIYLLLSFFTSGLIDSVAFNAWSCFVGMQTGRPYVCYCSTRNTKHQSAS
jgi:Protein of unknown function (DUF1275)